MSNPINIVYQTGTTGPQLAQSLDWTVAPFSTSAALYIVSGAASYAIEVSFDSEDAIAAGTDRWFETSLGQWQTASGFAAIQSPATFGRVNFNGATTGPCEFKLVQGLPV